MPVTVKGAGTQPRAEISGRLWSLEWIAERQLSMQRLSRTGSTTQLRLRRLPLS
jgi:hypothetical protein